MTYRVPKHTYDDLSDFQSRIVEIEGVEGTEFTFNSKDEDGNILSETYGLTVEQFDNGIIYYLSPVHSTYDYGDEFGKQESLAIIRNLFLTKHG